MGGIAGDEHAAGPIAVGDQLAAHPAHDRQELVIEITAHQRAPQRGVNVGLGVDHLVGRADDRHAEAIAAVDRHDGQPGALRPDEDEAVALALVVQRREVGAAEDHVGGVGQRRVAAHRDAGTLAHQAGAAVGADQIVGRRFARSRRARSRTVAITSSARFLERDQLGVVAHRHRAEACARSAAGSGRTCPAARARASAGSAADIFHARAPGNGSRPSS